MADIHVEKRNAVWPWILGLVVLALLIWAFVAGRGDDRAGVATTPTATTPTTTDTWRDDRTDRTDTPVATIPVTTPTTPGTTADTTTAPATGVGMQQEIPVAQILEQPEQYLNQTVSGTAQVAEVQSDSGLWVEQNGQRMFVVVEQADQMTGTTPTGTPGTQADTQAGTQTTPATQATGEQISRLNPGQTIRLTGIVHGQTTAAQVDAEPDARQIITTQPAFLVAQQQDIQLEDGMAAQQDDGW